MDRNKKIILTVAIIIAIIVVSCVLYITVFSSENKTSFSNKFMSGDFVGTVKVMNSSNEWAVAYKDPVHHIDYNMTSCKNASFLVDLYQVQGMNGPELREYNGQKWSIYTGQGVDNNTTDTPKNITVFMCVADKDNQSYVIYAIFNDNKIIDVDASVYCQGYDSYIVPLLNSANLKHNPDVPSLAELLGIDEQTFNDNSYLLNQANNGNLTALLKLAEG